MEHCWILSRLSRSKVLLLSDDVNFRYQRSELFSVKASEDVREQAKTEIGDVEKKFAAKQKVDTGAKTKK